MFAKISRQSSRQAAKLICGVCLILGLAMVSCKAHDPDDPYTYCSMCSANLARHRPEEAIKAAEGALAVDSSYAPAMANKAKALRMLGRNADADSLLQKARELFPAFRQRYQ
jgi:tetratricopeptide (TPR) repeat protein